MIYEYKHKGKTHFEFDQDGMTHVMLYKDGTSILYDEERLAEDLLELEERKEELTALGALPEFEILEVRKLEDAGKAAALFLDDFYLMFTSPVGDALNCHPEDLTIEDLNEALHELSRLTKEIHEAAERHLKSEAKTINGPTIVVEM